MAKSKRQGPAQTVVGRQVKPRKRKDPGALIPGKPYGGWKQYAEAIEQELFELKRSLSTPKSDGRRPWSEEQNERILFEYARLAPVRIIASGTVVGVVGMSRGRLLRANGQVRPISTRRDKGVATIYIQAQ